jgi:hypothetical protein
MYQGVADAYLFDESVLDADAAYLIFTDKP